MKGYIISGKYDYFALDDIQLVSSNDEAALYRKPLPKAV
jgi:hypothetical protein